MNTATVGAVMVVGGGVSGIQAALDLAESGYFVYLVEKHRPWAEPWRSSIKRSPR